MPIDPKKDPARRCQPFQTWPACDRRAWETATLKCDILEPGGDAADWAPHSRRKISKGYGRWLTWLDVHGLLDPHVEPAARITAERVRDYVLELKTLNAPYSVLARVQELYQAIRVMAPDRNWDWLRRIENKVRHAAVSVRNKRARVEPAERLFAFGIELMATANDPENGTPLKRACAYRNGLMIALLAARPLRRRNFASIELGRHLAFAGDGYWIRFAGHETKTGEPIEAPLPLELAPYLENYLSEQRPFLLARKRRWKGLSASPWQPVNALWISVHGSAMGELQIYSRICALTHARFGHAVSPHLFRDSAATSIAIEDPENVLIVQSVLGHRSFQTSERHYIHAKTLEASRRYQQQILDLRRNSSRHSKD